MDRHRRKFAQLPHVRAASFAAAHGIVLIRRIGRNICVARRHRVRPLSAVPSLRQDLLRQGYSIFFLQLKRAGLPRRRLILFRPQQSAARSVDEMKAAAGLANHRFIARGRTLGRRLFRQPVLHVHAGARAFENDIPHRVNSVPCGGLSELISVNVSKPGMCQRGILARREPARGASGVVAAGRRR
jgi:hypothetical protein